MILLMFVAYLLIIVRVRIQEIESEFAYYKSELATKDR